MALGSVLALPACLASPGSHPHRPACSTCVSNPCSPVIQMSPEDRLPSMHTAASAFPKLQTTGARMARLAAFQAVG